MRDSTEEDTERPGRQIHMHDLLYHVRRWSFNAQRRSECDNSEAINRLTSRRHTGQCSIRFGRSLNEDRRLQPMFQRETFFLTVMIPRRISYSRLLLAIFSMLRPCEIWSYVAFCWFCYVCTIAVCSQEDAGDSTAICRGGPSFSGDEHWDFRQWQVPAIANGMATLMLAFYSNMCMGMYMQAYSACQELKSAVIDVVTIASGTLKEHERRPELLLEFWRCANLIHLCTYVLADKAREVYSFDGFLLPIAEAFGEHDGDDKLGMLRVSELQGLQARLKKSVTRAGAVSELSNKRGDINSMAAVLNDAIAVRLYRLVEGVVSRKLTSVSWPVWGSALSRLRHSAAGVKQLALFRSPRIYRDFTRAIVLLAVFLDSILLAAAVGRAFSENFQWAWFAALISTVSEILLVATVPCVVKACRDMEHPFGSDILDMPCLSYVTGAAMASLFTAFPSQAGGDADAVMQDGKGQLCAIERIQTVDFDELIGTGSPNHEDKPRTDENIRGDDDDNADGGGD